MSMIVNVFFYVFFSFEFMRESRVNVDSIHFIYHICIPTCTIQYIYILYTCIIHIDPYPIDTTIGKHWFLGAF